MEEERGATAYTTLSCYKKHTYIYSPACKYLAGSKKTCVQASADNHAWSCKAAVTQVIDSTTFPPHVRFYFATFLLWDFKTYLDLAAARRFRAGDLDRRRLLFERDDLRRIRLGVLGIRRSVARLVPPNVLAANAPAPAAPLNVLAANAPAPAPSAPFFFLITIRLQLAIACMCAGLYAYSAKQFF